MLVPICQLRLHVILGRGSTGGRGDAFSPTSGHPSVGLAVYTIGFQRELPCHGFSPYDIFSLNKMPTNDQRLILLICLADRFIPPPDHMGSGVVCLDQSRKQLHIPKPLCVITRPQICPIDFSVAGFIYPSVLLKASELVGMG